MNKEKPTVARLEVREPPCIQQERNHMWPLCRPFSVQESCNVWLSSMFGQTMINLQTR